MNKSQITTELKMRRKQFLETIKDFSEQEMESQIISNGWTLKDILAHLARWEAELVKLLWQFTQGTRPTTVHFSDESVDEINARWYKESKSRPLEIVLSDFQGVREQTIRRVDALPQDKFTNASYFPWLEDEPLWKWIAADSFEHEAEHIAQIKEWQSTKGA